jgi:protein CpxP
MKANPTAIKRFLIAAVAGASLSVFAHAHPMGGHDHGGRMMGPHARADMVQPFGAGRLPHFLRGLKLSEAQQDKVFTILHEQAPKMREQAKAARQARDGLRKLVLAEQYDEAQARALSDAGAKAMAEMALLRARSERQIVALLTPEQRQAMSERKRR